jgi:hypothetical protein
MNDIVNGSPGFEPAQRVKVTPPPDEVLRKMNHKEWLDQFAEVLQVSPSGMTPMKAGAIGRLTLAKHYIQLLEAELVMLEHENDRLKRQLSTP